MNLWFLSLPRSGAVYQQRHYAATKRITSSLMVAAMELSPLYRTFQVYKFGNRKYNFLLNYFVVLNVWHGFVFCKIPISIPLNIETSIPRYFARRYSVRCWYRVPVYSPSNKTVSTYLLAGLTMSAKRDDQTAISKSLKSGTLPTFTMLRSLLSVEKVPRELVYRNFQELSSSGKFSHAFHCVVSYPRNKPFRKPW